MRATPWKAVRIAGAAVLWVALAPVPSGAQALNEAPRSQAAGGSRWEVEGYGGASVGRQPGGGSSAVPSAGPPLLTSTPVFPSRRTSSWLFGDGAALLNGVNQEFGVPSRITPLDTAFARLTGGAGAAFGVRVRRSLTTRVSVELGVDAMVGSSPGTGDLRAVVDATRDSFKTAFADLLATGPFASIKVDATSAVRSAITREVAVTGAVNLRVGPGHAWAPYATLGGGVMAGGGLPSATLDARYHFVILDQVPIDETDHVTLRYTRGAALVGVLGGGLRRELNAQWGINVDARVLLGPDSTRVLLDASPTSVRGTPAGFIESFTNPAIQFSNDPATGRESTLSGSPLRGFAAFTGKGLQTRVLLTLAFFRRF